MIPRLASLAVALALAGCQPSAETPPTSSGADTPGARPAAPLPAAAGEGEAGAIVSAGALVGEYRIAGVDGRDIDLPHGISASIDPTTIRVSADCLSFAWRYRFEGARLVTESTPVRSCRRGLMPEEEAIRAAFDAAQAVRRLPSNGIELTGGGRSVLLFSQ
jgi:hypothetical protein